MKKNDQKRIKESISKLPWIGNKSVVIFKYFKKNLLIFCSKWRLTSLIYYGVVNRSFLRELQAVLAGKAKYITDEEDLKSTYFLLIRNIHRIEKGLLMRPRREVFAKKYIEETVDAYLKVKEKLSKKENSQVEWFSDVLSEYFNVVGDDKYIDVQKKRFNSFNDGFKANDKIPYLRSSNKSNISFEDFYKLSKHRRSVRWFQQKKVPRNDIDKALRVALQSPSACNRQPFEFKIFDEPELVKKVIEIPTGTRGYAHNVPVVAVVIGNLDAYFNERDRHLIYVDGALASMSFMYALETLGISSCPINWPDIEWREKKMEKFLKLDLFQRPIMLIALGYSHPEGKVAFSEKRPIEMIRSYN